MLGFSIVMDDSIGFSGGETSQYARQILISTRAWWTNKTFLYILAHEVRHAQHIFLGKYRHYYGALRSSHDLNLGVAMRAELDCDAYALRMMAKHGIEHTIYKYKQEIIPGYWKWKFKLEMNRINQKILR